MNTLVQTASCLNIMRYTGEKSDSNSSTAYNRTFESFRSSNFVRLQTDGLEVCDTQSFFKMASGKLLPQFRSLRNQKPHTVKTPRVPRRPIAPTWKRSCFSSTSCKAVFSAIEGHVTAYSPPAVSQSWCRSWRPGMCSIEEPERSSFTYNQIQQIRNLQMRLDNSIQRAFTVSQTD